MGEFEGENRALRALLYHSGARNTTRRRPLKSAFVSFQQTKENSHHPLVYIKEDNNRFLSSFGLNYHAKEGK